MKCRNGFVSNSSSSSFVVAFKKVPNTKKELQNMLFENVPLYPHPYGNMDNCPDNYPTSEVAETVWQDMCGDGKSKPQSVTMDEVSETFSYGYLEGSPDYDNFKKSGDDGEIEWNALRLAQNKFATQKRDEFVANNPDCEFFTFSYGDDDGEYGCALEHGDLFDKLPHQRISCH